MGKVNYNEGFKNYVFTDFKLDAEWLKQLRNIKYLYAGEEICPTTGKMHWQGYLILKNKRSWEFMKRLWKDRWIKPMAGDIPASEEYCKKEGIVAIEIGEKPVGQGCRGDLNKLKEDILKGELTVDQILVERPFMYHQYGRTLEKLEDVKNRKVKRNWMTRGIWLQGPTGCGKSHIAYAVDEKAYEWKNDKGWQDQYAGEETVIIDDFRGEIKYAELLKMIDKYPFTISRRGKAPAPFLAKIIILTSPLSPAEVYHNLAEHDDLAQLLRRVQIIKFGEEPWMGKDDGEAIINYIRSLS